MGIPEYLTTKITADKYVIVNKDLDLFCDTKHCGNSSVSPVTVALPSSLPAFDYKFIAQAESLSRWSDVVVCKKW
jgi:hypothetical protein